MNPHEESISAEALLGEAGFLRRLAHALLGNEHDAADLAQETMRVALERPPRGSVSLRGWLATVASNLARNARRGEGRRAGREEAAARPERTEDERQPERLELQRTLFDLVLALPEEQRSVLYLRYYEELGPPAIAERLGVPLKTIKSRHTRALAALRERLDSRSGGDRRRWMEALAPLSIPGAKLGAGAARTAIGGLAVKKVVVASVAVVVALIAWRTLSQGWLRERSATSRRGGEHVVVGPPETKPAALAPPLAPEVLQQRQPLAAADPVTTGALRLTFLRSDGTPASDLPFAIECSEDPAPRVETFSARTAEDGTALIEGLFAGSARIWLENGSLDASVDAGTTRALSFTIPAGVVVEGTVVDPDGSPIPGAEIWSGHSRPTSPGGWLLGTSSSDGSFRLRDVSEEGPVGARKPGYRPSQCWRPWEMTAVASGVRTVRLVLGTGGGSVRGRVLDPEGTPIARALVLAGPEGGWTSGAQPGIAPQPAFSVTDERGEFALRSDLPAGKHPIHATARGFPVWRGEVEIVAGRTSVLDIQLDKPARIEGRVLGIDGEPSGGVTVLASEEERGGLYHDRFGPPESVTDGEGWFALDGVAPGLREVNAHDDRRPTIGRARASVPCTTGATATCELRLDLGLTIAGTVVDENGAPLAGFDVSSHSPPMRLTNVLFGEWTSRRARTDERGHFLLANLGNSSHDLIVRSEGDTRAHVDGVQAGTQDVVIVVADAHVVRGTLRGRFVSPQGERPESFVLTVWRDGEEEGLFLEPDEQGAFEMQVLPGRHQVRVAGQDQDLLVSEWYEVEPGGLTDVGELRIGGTGRVEIALPDVPSGSLDRLRLSFDREGCSTIDVQPKDGVLLSPEMMAGRWRVSMNTSDVSLHPSEVEVVAGTTSHVELHLEPNIRVTLVFTNPARDDVEVEAFDAGGTRFFKRTYLAPEGEATDERKLSLGLPQGHTTIRLRTHAGSKGELALDITPQLYNGPPIRVELR